MSTSGAVIVLAVAPGTPYYLDEDADPAFRLAFLDFTGSGYRPPSRFRPWAAWSYASRGKGDSMAWIAPQLPDDAEFLAFIDHDVLLRVSDINWLLFVGRAHALDLFQASLAHDSPHSHPHVLQRPGRMLRETSFVEIMMPVFSRRAWQMTQPLLSESVSGYGIDLLASQRTRAAGGRLAVVDAVMAKHMQTVSSPHRPLADGSTPLQALQAIIETYGLADYEIR